MADQLTLPRAFESAGLDSATAERIATEIYDAIHENVATKADARRSELAIAVRDLKIWMGSGLIVATSIIVAAPYYLR